MKPNTAPSAPSSTLIDNARACIERQDYAGAEKYLKQVPQQQDNSNHEAVFLMSKVLNAKGQKTEAGWLALKAMQMAPGTVPYMERFLDLVGDQATQSFNPEINAAIEACLQHPDALCLWRLERLWLTNLLQRPDFREAFAHAPTQLTENFSDFRPVLTPYFLEGLRHIHIHTLDFERLIVHLRRHILEDAVSPANAAKHLPEEGQLALGAALAHFCFRGEYILGYTSNKEKEAADALVAKARAGSALSAAEVAALACYAPLYKAKDAAMIEKSFAAHPALGSVVREQITEWRELNETARRIESATGISQGVSQAVQAQYEEFPYPRWNKFYTPYLLNGWKTVYKDFPFLKEILSGSDVQVLAAGCGTGKEPVGWAICEPKAKILAVDLSRISLALAQKRAKEHGVSSIDFRHGDILKLPELGRKFDVITCAGVLHHMENPLEGFRAVAGMLKPGGVIRTAFYSKTGRRKILAVQQAAKQNGYTPDKESMVAFRHASLRNLDRETLRKLSSYIDYYYLSMYRDLLFHAQETNYDLTEIATMLDTLGLEFCGFAGQEKFQADFLRLYPETYLRDLSRWHALEQKHPDTFGHMYQFWCRKKA
jgi:2-polyprenyl-3-methyl-5-hydroxy-6-metoxy-1,4-benzoquinol methylase